MIFYVDQIPYKSERTFRAAFDKRNILLKINEHF